MDRRGESHSHIIEFVSANITVFDRWTRCFVSSSQFSEPIGLGLEDNFKIPHLTPVLEEQAWGKS